MNKLLPVLRKEFSDYEPIKYFEAGIPVYYIRLAVEVLEKQPLTTFQAYFLHAISLGITTRQEIAHMFGVDDRDLVAPGASLLQKGYIEQGMPNADMERPIQLTFLGRQALTYNGPPPVPIRKIGQFHFNALTWTAMPLEDTWPMERMSKEGLYILPKKEKERPTLGVFTEKDVADAVRGAPAFQKVEIIALLEIKKAELEYIAPVYVFLLQHRTTLEQRLVIYRHERLLQAETVALQRLFEYQQFTLPGDAIILEVTKTFIPASLPGDVGQAVYDLTRNESEQTELEMQLNETSKSSRKNTDKSEQQAMEENIQLLKDELRLKREESTALRQQLQQHQVEFLPTEQHRPLLFKALREAQNEIIIISPWMNRRACDDELCRLVRDAIQRGVRIRIGYGMGKERDASEAARNSNNLQAVKAALDKLIPKKSAYLLEMKETSGTHQKILVCDRAFAVTGSFNWLSYVGKKDKEYRNETGTLFRQADKVIELAQIAMRALF